MLHRLTTNNLMFAIPFKNLLTICLSILSLVVSSYVHAINVSNANTVNEAQMTTAITGTGVTITNMTITNPGNCTNFRRGVGVFTNGTSAVGPGPVLSEPDGVVVSNSDFANGNLLDSSNDAAGVTDLLCNGTTSDPDMVAIEAGTNNGEYAAIEFDVVPAGTSLAIPFQFGSDEFPEYVCSGFGDLVGIFVSGPGINGPYSGALNAENYAKTAAGDLSSINWVNTGIIGQYGNSGNCGSLTNTAYYTDNSNNDLFGGNATVAGTNANLEMDGFTNTLYQTITVVAGQTYHVKIATADSADRQFDSAAFIHPLFSANSIIGFDYADAPDSYGTLTSNAGPNHGVNNSIYMGAAAPDIEITGFPSVNADGDDLDNTDDEDGVASFPVLLSNATSYSVNVNVTNNSGNTATLVGWIDFNANGTFESGEGTQTSVANGTTATNVALNWNSLSGLVPGNTYVRIRFSSDIGLSVLTTGSSMFDGEVEDYPLSISTVNLTKYVSTDATCSDTTQSLTVVTNKKVYYCYTVTNQNSSAFTVTAATDDKGLDISALLGIYAPVTSQTVVVGPLISGGAQLPTGVTTVNVAQVTADISGSNVVVNDSASLTVTLPPPADGVKQLYFDNVDIDSTGSADLTRDPTDVLANTTSSNISGNATYILNQSIPFAAPFTFSGGNDVTVQMWLRERNGGGTPNNDNVRTVQVQLFKGISNTQIGNTNFRTWDSTQWSSLQVPITIPSDVTLLAGDFIRVVLTNTSANGGRFKLRTLRNGIKSQLQIQSSTVINVDSVDVFALPWPDMTQYSSYAPGSTVSIRATVSDPFGSDDITGGTITIDDPNSPPSVVTNDPMTVVVPPPTPAAGTQILEYSYVIPAAPEGYWPLSVTANEGFEGTVMHTGTGVMLVGTLNITISKNSAVISDPVNTTNPKAIPGAIVEYTIAISNSGSIAVDADTTVIDDPIAAGTTFSFGLPVDPLTFIDGAVASGLSFNFIDLASTTDDIDFSNDGGTTFVTPTTDASGFDTTSPPINFIRINPKGAFKGSLDGINNPSAQMKFRVRVN